MANDFEPNKKIKYDQSQSDYSDNDRDEINSFVQHKNFKNENQILSEDEQIERKPIKKKVQKSKKKSNKKKPRQIGNKENKQLNKSRIKNDSQNPDHQLNRSIVLARKKDKRFIAKIPKMAFQRLVKDITRKISMKRQDFDDAIFYRYTRQALSALQCNAEGFLIEVMQDSYLCTNHAKRVTLMNRDLFLARRIRGPIKQLINIKYFDEINQTIFGRVFTNVKYNRKMNQEKFEEGQVVWAKLGRFPWWPAIVKQPLNDEEFEVEYLGDLSRSFLPNNKIQRFEDMSIPDKPSKALQQSIQNAIDIAEGRMTRDQLFTQLTNIPVQPVKQTKKKMKKISAKKKIKKIKTASKKMDTQIDHSENSEIIQPMSALEFSKKLSTSIQAIDIKVIEKDFQDFLNNIDDSTENKKGIAKNLMSYEQNLDYFDIMDIYQSNIGVLIDDIIKQLDKKKLNLLKDEFISLKKSVTKRILSGFFEDKERNKVDSIFSDAQTDFPALGSKENKNNKENDKKRVIFRVQKKLSK